MKTDLDVIRQIKDIIDSNESTLTAVKEIEKLIDDNYTDDPRAMASGDLRTSLLSRF